MEDNIMDFGNKIKCMDKDVLVGLMVEDMKDNTKEIKNRILVCIIGLVNFKFLIKISRLENIQRLLVKW